MAVVLASVASCFASRSAAAKGSAARVADTWGTASSMLGCLNSARRPWRTNECAAEGPIIPAMTNSSPTNGCSCSAPLASRSSRFNLGRRPSKEAAASRKLRLSCARRRRKASRPQTAGHRAAASDWLWSPKSSSPSLKTSRSNTSSARTGSGDKASTADAHRGEPTLDDVRRVLRMHGSEEARGHAFASRGSEGERALPTLPPGCGDPAELGEYGHNEWFAASPPVAAVPPNLPPTTLAADHGGRSRIIRSRRRLSVAASRNPSSKRLPSTSISSRRNPEVLASAPSLEAQRKVSDCIRCKSGCMASSSRRMRRSRSTRKGRPSANAHAMDRTNAPRLHPTRACAAGKAPSRGATPSPPRRLADTGGAAALTGATGAAGSQSRGFPDKSRRSKGATRLS
mmetsp:Transcript_65409/g.181974  ORF Transcript_65409/g.181974 Transcript_65409/m.181974 type:complete len:400 (+) Transcript_65409:569-1768(+)